MGSINHAYESQSLWLHCTEPCLRPPDSHANTFLSYLTPDPLAESTCNPERVELNSCRAAAPAKVDRGLHSHLGDGGALDDLAVRSLDWHGHELLAQSHP